MALPEIQHPPPGEQSHFAGIRGRTFQEWDATRCTSTGTIDYTVRISTAALFGKSFRPGPSSSRNTQIHEFPRDLRNSRRAAQFHF